MHVVRHYNVSSEPDAPRFANACERDYSFVDRSIRQDLPTPIGIEGDEVERRVVTIKDWLEPRGSLRHSAM
jgi:hypothetical protein